MEKFRKGKILVIAILMMIASFFAFTGKVNAYWESNDSDCRKANKSPRVHYYVEGREVNKGDPGLQKASLDVATWNTNWKDICTTFTIPGSYFNWSFSPDTSFEYSSNKHIVRSLDGKRGVIAWYDNPEFEGKPVVDLYPAKNYWDKDVYLYGKMGEIINIYVNGREKTVVVGRKYSPSTLETDYVVQTGAYIYDDNRPVVQKGLYATDVEFFENANPKQETQNRRLYYFRDVTQKQVHANIVPQTPYKLYVDNTEFLPLLDYTTCKNYNGVSCSAINPETGEVFDYNYLLENHLTDLNSVPIRQTRNISKYYKYVGFVDSEGNEYEDVFEMKKEYEGKNFTPLVESKMSCTRIGAGYMNYAFSLSKINNMDIEFDGDILTGDFNPEYMTHKKGYSADSEDYPDDKIGLMISTCIPQDVYIKKTYTFSKNIETEYSVVMEGTSGEKVKKGTKYVLPTEGKPKAAEVFTVTLKYQDNKTADETLSYTKIYTPNGFIIDGVHYDFGSSFIVEKDTYIYYDYDYVVVGPDLPTDLTRENYIFKGWYDAISGGHIVEDARTNTSSVLYAQWLDKDKVFVTRPDGITIELYKGTSYTLPDIPYKDESYIAKVAFYRNDGTGTKTFSDVVIYYEKNGMTCKETGVHYNVGQTIVVNENMTFVGDYNERIKPATFPNDPIRDDYEFVGWFDEVEGGQQYTEYSGDKDLILYGHWQETSSTVTIKYVSDERVDIEMHDGKPAVMKKNIFEVEKNSIYQLEKVPNDGYQFFITAVYQDGKTPNETNKYSIGWARKGTGWLIDGVHYDSNEVIIADRNMIAHWEYSKVFQFLNFPEDPTRPGYKFLGWYDDPTEGTKYTTYDGFYPITLYAHWEKINEEYILPEITAKNPETVATVTLKFQDGITKDKKKYVKKNYVAVDYTVNGGEYNNEHFNVGDTINPTDDVTITPNYEEQIVEVELYSATRDGYMFAGWYDEEEGGTRYYNYSGTEDITLYAQWTTEPIANVCRRATTLHKSGNKTYGNLGTPGSLVPGDAFDCDVNGDGIYDPETERFYYINDLWDAENDTFVESVASLVYYADYYNGPLSSSSKDGFVKYSSTIPNDGPNVAATILPTTDEWSNVSLYKTVRQLSWPANGKTNSNGPLGTYDYSGYAARMVHGMELFQSGCLYSYNNKIMAAYYNLNNSCEFLTENIRRAPDGRKEDAYWIESPGGYCPNGYCPADRAFPDFNKYAWALIKKSSSEYSSYMYQSQIEWSRGVRPVIDVPKTSMEDVPEHTIYHTITYPEGQEQVSLHGSTFVFGDVMSGPETERLASVKFYPESGIMYEKFVERTTIPTAYKIGNTRYDKGSELLVLDDYQLEYIYVETLKPVEFPEDPTRSGYIFKGWYDAVAGGNEYTSYSGEEDLTLYARWENEDTSLTHTVTYPNGDTEKVEHGTKWTFPKNKSTREDEEGAIVTFDYQNGDENTTARVTKQFIASGWTIDNVHYDDGKRITVNEDIILAYDYVVTYVSPEFPTGMTRDGYTFSSWFDAPAGGTRYESYAGDDNITLYAHWNPSTVECTETESYTLGTNNTPKADDIISTVTFKYHNGNADTTSSVVRYYEPNGWLVDGNRVKDGATIEKCDTTIIEPYYEEYIRNAEFPEIPTKNGYMFTGWFTEETGGTKVVNYNNNSDIVLHAQYTDNYSILTGGVDVQGGFWYKYTALVGELTDEGAQFTFRKATTAEYNAATLTDNDVISTNDSPIKTYIWLIGNDVVYYSEADVIFFNPDSSYLFWSFGGTVSMDLSGINSSLLTNTQDMFSGTSELQSVNFGDFDASHITNMNAMFYGNYALEELDVSNWNTQNVTSMEQVFEYCQSLEELDVSNWNTENVTNMMNMFANMDSLTSIDVSNFNTRNVEDMSGLFSGDYNITSLDLSNFNTSNVTDMRGMFALLASVTELDLSSFDTSNVELMEYMFATEETNDDGNIIPESSLRTIYVSDMWTTENLSNDATRMFYGLLSIEGQKGTTYDSNHINKEYAIVDDAPDHPGYLTLKRTTGPVYHSVTYPDGFVEIVEHGTEIVLPSIPDDMIVNATVTFKPENGESDIVRTANKSKIYNGLLIDNELYEARTSYTVNKDIVITIDYEETDIPVEFPEDPTKEGYTFLGWYTAKVGGDRYTEYDGNEDLTLYAQYSKNDYVLPENDIPKDSEVNSTVTFKYHNGNPDTTADVIKYYKQHGWLVDGVKHPNGDILENAEGAVIEPNYDTFYMNVEFPENPTKEGYQFIGWYTEETGGELVTVYNGSEDITLHAHYSNKNSYLLNGTEFYNKVSALSNNTRAKDFRKATSEEYEAVKNTLGSNNIVSIAGSPYETFAWLDGNTFLYYSEADTIFAHEYCDGMFYSTLFDNVDVSGINFINTTSMNSMFANVMGSKNLTGFNTSKVTSMRDMFAYNRVAPDLSSFDTSHVTNMREMFFCTYYSNIDVSNFDTHNVTNMDRMFAGNGNNAHSHFVTLDLRNFDTGNVTTVNHMFYHTRNLQTLHIENFDTHNVKDFTAFVSWSDVLTSVDVTNFDTSNATTMAEMFRRLYSVTELDLSSFDTSKVTSTRIMFEVSNNLKTIYVSRGWDVSNANGSQMFKDDIKLVGQRGTTFDSNHIDNKYAVVDLAPERPGYLTFKGYYIITYPDGTKIEVEPGSVFTFPTNNDSKDSVRNAKVTFKYNDGVTPDYESYVGLDYINDGWKVGDKYYQDGEEIVVNSDLTLEYNNVETATGARFPEDPTRNGYTFKGWYDSPAGGDKYTSYNKDEDITLYAHWNIDSEEVAYDLGVNNISKDDEIISTVTFKYHNGDPDTTSNVVRQFVPHGWLVDGVWYADGTVIQASAETVIVPNYNVFIRNASFPTDPTKTDYEFTGWFTEETGGTKVTVLNSNSNLTVHAQYTNSFAYLIPGEDFSGMVKYFIQYDSDGTIFRKATLEEYNNKPTGSNRIKIISTEDSPNEAYLWESGKNLLYYSEADVIFLNENCYRMFYVYSNKNPIVSIDMSGLNSSKVVNMMDIFGELPILESLNISNFDTHNATNMSSMFFNDYALPSLDLSNFDTSKATNMSGMFANTLSFTSIDVSGFDTKNVTNMHGMFMVGTEDSSSLASLDLSNFDTSNVTDMSSMFRNLDLITSIDVNNFDTSKVTNFNHMFSEMDAITELDLSSFDTHAADDVMGMLAKDSNLVTVYVSDKWDMSNVTSYKSSGMFNNTENIVGQKGTTYNSRYTNNVYAIIDDAPEHPGYLTYKGYKKTYTITYPDGTTEVVPAGTEFKFPSNVPEKDSENIATVTFKPENDTEDIVKYVTKAFINPGWMIEDTHYDIGDIYVVNSDITLAYDYVETIEGVRFPSNPTKEGYVFDGWYNGNTKYTSYNNEEDITLTAKWKIEIPTSGEYVLPENNTPKDDEAISTILFKYHNGNPDTVTNVLRRFIPNGWLVNGVHKDAGEIINITKNTVIEPDYNIQIVNGEFPGNAAKTGYKFMGWYTEETGGEKVTVLDSLTDITLHAQYTNDYAILEGGTNFKRELTSMLTDYTYSEPGLTFRRATPEELAESASYNNRKDMKTYTSPNPVYMWFTGTEVLYGSPASTIFLDSFGDEMFQITFDNPMASKFGTIDVSGLNTINTATMRSMFSNNGNLKRIILGDFDTGNSWNLSNMFNGDVSLESIDVSGFDTRKAESLLGMFKGVQVTELDVDQFDLRKANDIRDIFNGASKLESIDVSNWDTSNILFISGVFKGCSSITELDVSNWNTSNVKLADNAFANMPLLTELDLSSWDTSNVYQTYSMFAGDTNLKTIYVSDKWTTYKAVNDSYNKNLFKDDVSIVGQEGTTYDPDNVGVAYAHVDEGPSNPGYLTYKGPKRYKVTYPDGTSDSAVVGTTYTFRTNDSTKEDEDIAVVTFKPSNGEEDITVNVTKSYTANGWKHNNSHINSGHSMKVEEDMVLTYDYSETINNITFPADPVKEDYTFVGWFDSRTGGTMYTSYNGENDLTLYARYSTDKPEPGTIYNLGVNNTSKADTTATVIFKYNDEDQTPDATMVISKQYLPSGWLVDGVHYDDNASVTYVEGMVIEPDYAETITSGTWPSDPTRFQYTFQGWFDSLSGGNKYTINDIESDITLYAHWTGQGFPTPIEDVLCYRARDISSNIYAGGEFGSLGTDGELNTSDAYICDVNGDGILDSINERFYYLSDYYNGLTGEFDNTYATMVYSLPVSNGAGFEVTCFGCSASAYYDNSNGWYSSKVNYNGPLTAVNEIPTTSQWPNATLFTRDRQIRTVDGETFIQGPYTNSQRHELPVFSYSGYAARMITIQEYNEGCNQNISSSTIGDWNNSIPDKCNFLTEGLDFWEAGPDAPETEYNEFLFESPVDGEENVVAVGNERGRITSGDSGAVKVAIDVPKDKIDLRVGDKTYTIHYPNNTTETVKEGTVFTVPSHNSKKNSVNGAKVTFKPENGGSDIIGYVTKKYVPNGFKIANNEWSTGTHYDIDSTITVNSDLYLKYDWAETYLSVIYPNDIIKAGYELDDWYTEANGQGTKVSSYNGTSNITLYANWTKKTSGKYTLPENTIGRNPEDVATVTFVYLNGRANTTSKVVATYTPNGWLVDGVHKDAGEVINMTPDTVLEPDYIRTVSPAAFPANPTRTNFVFKGWVDNENYNSTDDYNYYTTYDGGEDLTLYAKWETDDDHCSITYSDGEVKVVTCGTNITVPTNVNTESEIITFHYMYAWEDEMMGYVEKYETSIDRTYYTKASVENYKIGDNTYNVGESFTVNDDIYVERNLGNPIYNDEPFSVPDDAYNFVAWFTDWNDGVQVKSYYDYKSKGLTTHNLYGHYNDYESWEDPEYSVVVDGVEVGTFTEGTSYTAPAGTNVDEDLATVTLINGETTNTYKVHKTGTFNNYKVELGDSEGYIEEDGTLDAGSSITVNSNIFLTSQYDPETITGVDLPVLESNEYTTFKGWYKNENGSGPKYSGTYTDPIDITLYAYFDGKSATVYYYADETENAELIYTGNYKYGDTVDTSNMAVGGTVAGKGKLHVVYQNGTTDNDMIIPLEVTKQVDHWKDVDSKTYNKVYVVDFIGTKALTPVFGDGTVVSYTLPDPDSDIYPGYTFTGWYTEPQGGTRVTKITEDKDTTVYAHWTRNNNPVCIYTDGRTEECNPGDTKTVPQRDSKVVSRIYEVANGLGSYRDYIYKTIPVYAHQTVAYYEIDGTKYYPGDTYTIENNTTNIKPYYSSTTVDSSRLDSSVEEENIEEWFNNDGVARVFTGWYTERTGGDLVISYEDDEDLYVYAHYEENTPDKEFYNVTFIDITNVSTTYSMLKGTEIKLQNEEIHQTASYYLDPDNGEEKIVGHIHAWVSTDYEVNGTKYHANDIVTVNSDLTIRSVLGTTNVERMPKDVPNPVKEGYVFTGWYINDNLYDMNDNSLENIAMIANQTLVAHYEEYNPTTDVIVDFDGNIRIVPKGTTEVLPNPSTDWDYLEITFDSQREYDDYIGVDIEKNVKDYTVNGESVAPGTEVTYMVDTTIRTNYDIRYEYDDDYGVTYPELYDWSDRYSDFRGWSDANGNIVEDASNITSDITLYARYAPRYNLTVDGVTTQVPEGYIYTVPNGSTNGDSISFTLDYNYPDHDPVTKEVTIASGKGINYQLINGDRYDVSETYIVMGDTVVESITNDTDTITMIPEISTPTFDGYFFVAWVDEDRMNPVDIYKLTPEDKYYDGRTLKGFWEEDNINDSVTVTIVDEFAKSSITNVTNRGMDSNVNDIVFAGMNINNEINSTIHNNINSDVINMTIDTTAPVTYFLYNGVRYEKGDTITLNEDGTIEIIRDVNTTIECDGSECPSVIFQKPNTSYNEYTFQGIFDEDDNLVDISKIVSYGSPFDDRYEELLMKLVSAEDTIILTVDNEVSIIPKGMGNIPDAKTKASDVYKVTYDYNDGSNRKVSDNIVTRYTFEHYYVVGKGEFEAGTAYNYLENTTMNSVFSKETIYPEMRTIKTENFLGWFTEPHGGEEVTSLEGINRDITLFARYNNDHVNIYIDNVANPVLYGEEFTLPAGTSKSDKSITFTLDYNYDNRTEDYTISTSFEFTGYEMDGNNYEPGYTFEATEDKYVTSKYNITNVFTPEYTEPEREGYIFNGWFNGTEKVNVSELTAENAEINGKTLTASWTEITPDDVVVTYDGEQRVVPIGTKLSELGDSPIKPSDETFTVYIDRNNGTFIIDTYEITKSYDLDKVYINGEELNENDYTFNEDTTVTTSYTASYEPNIFEGLTSDISGIFTEAVGGVKVENYDNVNDGDTLYYQYGETHTITVDGEVIATVPHGSEYTLPVNTKPRNMENIATVTFDYGYDKDPYITYVRKRFNSNGWSINGDAYANNEKITVNEDIVLEREYYETIQGIEFPGTPKRSGYRFNGWYYNDEEITSYNGTEDITITANWIKLIIITYLDDGSTEIVDAGTTKVFEPVPDTEEVFHNITFKYNYEGSPEDKVVRISSHGHYVGWTINGTDEYNDGDEITFNENSTVKARYEDVISNKNLPEDPVREGYDFLGWYDGKNIENSNKVDITKIAKTMTVYGQYKVSGEHVVYFDGRKYTYTDATSVDTENLGFMSDTKENVITLTLDYQNKSIENESIDYTIVSTFVNWTDENGETYGKVIDLTNVPDGMHFTSNYDTEEFTPVDLSTYNPDIDDFLGWYTNKSGGEEVFTYNGNGDATYYAQYDEIKQVIVTIDGEVTIYSVGETFNLPENSIKSNDEIVITFDPQNGEEVFTKSIVTSYTFTGFRLDTDNELYQGETEFTANTDMTFTSEYTSNTTGDTWPSNPSKDDYIFLGWYTNQTSGIEVFNFDGITSNTSLYAHYTTDDESFVTLTNTVTGESLKVQKSTDWVFGDSKFNKDNKEKLGTITYKFNSTGYPDEVKDYYRTSTPTGYYIEGDDTLYNIDEAHQFTSDTNITPYYGNVVTDSHVGIDQFDYEITNGDKKIKCFSKTNQTDPHDDEEYTCYENYDENDGDVTVYLHWKELKKITVTEPNGDTNEYTEGDTYNTGTNNSTKDSEGYTVTFKYQDGTTDDTTQEHRTSYTANGWLINGEHVDNNTDITLEEDLVKEYDYTSSSTTITLPEPTRDDYTFAGWNSRANGKGTTYTNESINALDKDTTVYAIWTKDEINITFVENGGSDVDDMTIEYDTPIGDLPTTSKENERVTENNNDVIIGYIFDGWYRDPEFTSKVSSTTTFTEDTTLYAKWVEDRFPYVYPYHEENFVCTGSNYIDTGVKLYTNTNNDYLKDFEVGFTIESYNPSGQVKQATFFNAKWENTAEQWPGVAFRRKDATNNLELSSSVKKVRVAQEVADYTLPLEVKIYRIDNVIYLSTDGGVTKTQVQDTTGFSQFFDVNSYFCAGDNGNGGIQRYVKGTISNYYIKLGDYQGTVDDVTTHTVTYPDNSVETYGHNSIIELDANESTKADELGATVTFDYNDGVTPSEIRYNTKTFTPNGFIVNDDTHYDDNSTLVVDEDKVITYDYNSENTEVEFPSDPVREYYVFDGWYTEGGDKVEYYDGEEDITLYAHYTRETVDIIYPDETITVNKGDEYELRSNDITKADDNAATVTFKYHDDETEDLVRYVKYHYTANGWSIDGTAYADNATITPVTNTIVTPAYTSETIEVEFPSDPGRENYTFDGWFTEETGGDKVESYNGESDITLHAHWNMTLPTDFDIDVNDITIMVGETHQIEVTFTPDGTEDTVTYTGYDGEKISVADGLVTGLAKGETTITVGLENVPDKTKEITVTIISDRLESDVYDVREEDIDLGKDRVIVGAEPLTTIGEFKDNLLNPKELVKIYDSEGNEVDDDEDIRTGLVIKLEYNGIVADEAILVLRGDVDGDGVVNLVDYMAVINHYVESAEITEYPFFLAADVDEDETINMADAMKILNYYTENIDTLNN